MSLNYETTDRMGNSVKVAKSNAVAGAVFVESWGCHVKADDLPELVEALYRAAGQEPPEMVSPHYPYVDSDGDRLDITRSIGHSNTAYVSCGGVFVTAEALPKLVEELYKGTGQEPPFTVPRPDCTANPDNPAHTWRRNNLTLHRRADRIEVNGQTTDSAGARALSGMLLVLAGEADAHLPAEAVERLANLLGDAIETGVTGEALARHLLRAGCTLPEVAE